MRTTFALIAAAGLVAAQAPPTYDDSPPEDVSSAPEPQSSAVEAVSSAPAYNPPPYYASSSSIERPVEKPSTYAPPPPQTTTWVAPPVKSSAQPVVTTSETTHVVVYSTITAQVAISSAVAVNTPSPIYPVPQNSTVLATGTGVSRPSQLPMNAATGLQTQLSAAVIAVAGLLAFLA